MLNWFKSLDRVLKGEATQPTALGGGRIELPLGGLTVVLLLLGLVYGACMGTFAVITRWHADRAAGWLQLAYSAVKVPLLFFLTILVTFPSLYVFNALVGSRLAFGAVLRLLVAALAVTLAVLASFGTIVVFFSLCTTSYPFMVLLNVVMFAVAGVLGMGFLLQTLHRLSVAQALRAARDEAAAVAPVPFAAVAPGGIEMPMPPPIPPPPGALDRLDGQVLGAHVKTVFRVWVLVFGLVGAQMGWVLRPFIGDPAGPVTFFRARESNFFEAVFHKVDALLFGPGSTPSRRGAWGGELPAPAPPPAVVPPAVTSSPAASR